MNDTQPVTKDYFTKRLVDLCLRSGLSGFPKDDLDQHILLKSMVLTIAPGRAPGEALAEKAVDEKLKYWISNIGQIKKMDHATLRRRLVDTGYLVRSKDGSSYQVAQPGPRRVAFEPAVDEVNVEEVIQSARAEIERRKQAYLAKNKPQG